MAAELEAGGPVETVETERAGHAAEIAEKACGDSSAIYVFAGDGGFNEAVNGMHGPVPIGFVPGGASNVLVRALGLPNDAVGAARRLARAERERVISLGVVELADGEGGTVRRRFTFCGGVGLDAELVRAVDRRGRREGKRPGDLAFVQELGRILAARRWRLDPVLEVEGHGRAAFAVAANCDPYTYAGPFPSTLPPGRDSSLGSTLSPRYRSAPPGSAGSRGGRSPIPPIRAPRASSTSTTPIECGFAVTSLCRCRWTERT